MNTVKNNRDMKFLLSETEEDVGKNKVKHEWLPSGKRTSPFALFEDAPIPFFNHGITNDNQDAVRIQNFVAHRHLFGEPTETLPHHLTSEELREMNFSEVSLTDGFYEQQVQRISEEINQEIRNLTRRYSHRSRRTQFVEELEQVLDGYRALGSLVSYSIEEREGLDDTLMYTRHAHFIVNLRIPRGSRTEQVHMGVIL